MPNKKQARKPKDIKVLSLFSGIGGLDIGYHKAGFDVVAAVEWDHDCCETLRANIGRYSRSDMKVVEGDITKLGRSDIYPGKVDFIIGGPPCQTFSAIGRRAGGAAGTLDDRGNLFQHYCRILEEYKPAGFMFENVRGILSSHKGEDWKRIQAAFEELGYSLKFRLLDAAAYGVPQHRERLILIGYRKGEFLFPRPTNGPDSRSNKPHVGAKEATKGLRVNRKELIPSGGQYDDLLQEIPPGLNYLYYTSEMGHPEPRFAWRSRFSDFLYKADPQKPVKTVVASMGRYSGPFHWEGRRFSIKEFKRLQGIPDGFILTGSAGSQIKQIGNSVAPPFAYQLARAVAKGVFGLESDVEQLNDNTQLTFDRRKGQKALITRAARKKTQQASLFDQEKIVEKLSKKIPASANFSLKYSGKSCLLLPDSGEGWKVTQRYSKGILKLHVSERGESPDGSLELVLTFRKNVLPGIDKISARSSGISSESLSVVWDTINCAVRQYSSYPSIHELYGHFTEPNPKFDLSVRCDYSKPWSPELQLFTWMADMANASNLYPLSVAENMGFDVSNEKTWVSRLRALRFDVRTNLTNSTIPEGKFRLCYPYVLPIDRRSFVTIK